MTKYYLTILMILPAVLSLACQAPPPKTATPATATTGPTTKPQEENYLAKTAVSKSPDANGETAVENALNWANKYAQANQNSAALEQENRTQRDKVQALSLENQKLQMDLAAAQGELKQANTMLMEMRQELVKWKMDIMGFRQETRVAQQAQLQAMARILKLLGGEMPAATVATPATSQPKSSPATEPTSAPAH